MRLNRPVFGLVAVVVVLRVGRGVSVLEIGRRRDQQGGQYERKEGAETASWHAGILPTSSVYQLNESHHHEPSTAIWRPRQPAGPGANACALGWDQSSR